MFDVPTGLEQDFAYLIYDTLITRAGASPNDRYAFVTAFPRMTEWRFMGDLGFGGKFWRNYATDMRESAWYVNCYREDEDAYRLVVIDETNAELAKLYRDFLELS